MTVKPKKFYYDNSSIIRCILHKFTDPKVYHDRKKLHKNPVKKDTLLQVAIHKSKNITSENT